MTTEPTPLPTPGIWIAASRVHGRPVRVDEDYPHICHHIAPGNPHRHGGNWPVTMRKVGPKGCIACAEQAADK